MSATAEQRERWAHWDLLDVVLCGGCEVGSMEPGTAWWDFCGMCRECFAFACRVEDIYSDGVWTHWGDVLNLDTDRRGPEPYPWETWIEEARVA